MHAESHELVSTFYYFKLFLCEGWWWGASNQLFYDYFFNFITILWLVTEIQNLSTAFIRLYARPCIFPCPAWVLGDLKKQKPFYFCDLKYISPQIHPWDEDTVLLRENFSYLRGLSRNFLCVYAYFKNTHTSMEAYALRE